MDLTTKYLGLKLKTPLVASSSPLCKEISTIRQLEDGGASAIVLHSLFEEQINLESNELDYFLSVGSDVSAEALEMFPDMTGYNIGPDDYLEHIRKAKAAVKVPIIASLNGISTGGWIRYAKEIQQAGADALELNIYYLPTDVELTGSTVEKAHCELVTAIKDSINIPIAVKLAPYFSSIANMAKQLDESGRECTGAVQSLLPARLRPGAPGSSSLTRAEPLQRGEAAAALGGDPLRPDQGRYRDHRRRTHRGRRGEVHDGRRQGRHDDFSHSGVWPTVFRCGRERPGTLDGRTRIRIYEADAGQHEHAEGEQSFGIPARQLHEGP